MSEPRPLQPGELPRLGALLNDIFRHSRGVHDQDILRDFPLTFAAGVLRVRFDLFMLLVVIGKGGRYAAILAGVDALAAVG